MFFASGPVEMLRRHLCSLALWQRTPCSVLRWLGIWLDLFGLRLGSTEYTNILARSSA